jgi:hypothetical protein
MAWIFARGPTAPAAPPSPARPSQLTLLPGMLKVLVEGATDLEAVGPRQQPFYILECGTQRSRSKAAAEGTAADPVWRKAHKFALTSNDMVMRVTIKDEATRAVIGDGLIDLSRWVLVCVSGVG